MFVVLRFPDMEYRGVKVDLKKLKSMESLLLDKLKAVEQECYGAAGKSFQINSTLQVRNILYEELNLDTKSNVKIRETITTGAKSTSESMVGILHIVKCNKNRVVDIEYTKENSMFFDNF